MGSALAAGGTEEVISHCRTAVRLDTVGLDPSEDSGTQHMKATGCIAFLSGFVAGYNAGSAGGGPKYFCTPETGASPSQLAAIFVQWADRNPRVWHEPLAIVVTLALSEAFPCRR
jgi:hypothetical protein